MDTRFDRPRAQAKATSDSIVTRLEVHAAMRPDELAFRFIDTIEGDAATLTFGDLSDIVRQAADGLRTLGATNKRVLLLFPQGLDFVCAFYAVLGAGGIAVPAPSPTRALMVRDRLAAVAQDAEPFIALTTPDLLPEVRKLVAEIGETFHVTTVDEIVAEGRAGADLFVPGPNDLALIQYTSGSTSTPKGVIITHGNLVANQKLIAQCFGHNARTVFVGWLPMYHDMGLIGHMIQPVWLGVESTLMSPISFLIDPVLWLRAITRYGGTTSGAPNFAYDFCVDRIPEADREGLDLSNWTVAYNGSEPIRASTLDNFARSFERYGFRREAIYPCYGMAEATLFIAGSRRGKGAAIRDVAAAEDGAPPRRVVSCGTSGADHEIVIVDPETHRPLPDGETGEVWFAGPSVTPGYWRKPALNTETVGVATNPAGAKEGYLRTGDLGFFTEGELHITGRIKDVLIVRGRNHYPHDIEATAQASHAALCTDAGAVFAVDRDNGQALVLVQEIFGVDLASIDVEALAGEIRAAVVREHGLRLATVMLVRKGGVPKTSSGKIQRAKARTLFLSDDLPVLAVSGALPSPAPAEARAANLERGRACP